MIALGIAAIATLAVVALPRKETDFSAAQSASASSVLSPWPSLISHATDCGTGATFIDYFSEAGWATPEQAVRWFVDSQSRVEPADAKAAAERDAIIASAVSVRYEGRIDGRRQFASRDEQGTLAMYWVSSFGPGKYVVDAYWVRLPPQYCPSF